MKRYIVATLLASIGAILHFVQPHGHNEAFCGGAELLPFGAAVGTLWGKAVYYRLKAAAA